MSTSLPDKKSVTYILCEEVRIETEGKISLLGTFLANRVFVKVPDDAKQTDDAVAMLSGLAIVAIFRGGSGTYPTQIQVFSPKGEAIVGASLGNIDFTGKEISTAIFKINGFRVPAFGNYEARFLIGSEEYNFQFTIEQKKAKAKAA